MSLAAQRTELPAGTEEQGPAPFISRQPVLDAQNRVTGYRVAYATSAADGPAGTAEREGATTRLFGDILSVVGLEEVVGSALAHLAVSRRLLLSLGVPPVRPDQVVLRVAYEHALDPDLAPVLDALTSRGYALSVFDLQAAGWEEAALERFGIVELDWSAHDPERLGEAAAAVLRRRATPMAVGVGSYADYEKAKTLGFQLFAGAFYSSPRITAVRDVPVSGLSTLATVARLNGAGAVEDLEQVIDRDLGLSVKLLRYINSAYFGMRSQITSIRQAVMMLGARGVSRWAMMVVLTGGTAAPEELSVMALTRARMCELLAARRADVRADEMFTVGLLSFADALLDAPMERILEELPLAEEISSALLRRDGAAGSILDAVASYEVGSFEVPRVQAHGSSVAQVYLEALRWAQETVAGMS